MSSPLACGLRCDSASGQQCWRTQRPGHGTLRGSTAAQHPACQGEAAGTPARRRPWVWSPSRMCTRRSRWSRRRRHRAQGRRSAPPPPMSTLPRSQSSQQARLWRCHRHSWTCHLGIHWSCRTRLLVREGNGACTAQGCRHARHARHARQQPQDCLRFFCSTRCMPHVLPSWVSLQHAMCNSKAATGRCRQRQPGCRAGGCQPIPPIYHPWHAREPVMGDCPPPPAHARA